jgi:pyrroline-5-carboxylate reductase
MLIFIRGETNLSEINSVLDGKKLAFVGSGVMAEAMISGLLEKKLVKPENIIASHPRTKRTDDLHSRLGIQGITSNREAGKNADIILICVKPQRLRPVLNDLSGVVNSSQLIISIVAGANSSSLARQLNHPAVVRVMPNTPAQIGYGMSVWTNTPEVSEAQRQQTKTILSALGKEMWFEEEKFVDMATAISASGPAYVFLVMEALIDAAVHLGFSRLDARELVTETLLGSVLFAQESQKHPAELRNMVTSPNGTSAEALYQLEKGGLRTILSKAVYAAYQKTAVLNEMINK